MVPVAQGGSERDRRRVTADIREGLRGLSLQLSLLNRQVSARLALRDVDMDCLDLINAHGPINPTVLARRAGLHAATMTGVLDRLEKAGWVLRERDPADRRSLLVRALRDRNAELLELFATMTESVEQICADYDAAELQRIDEFLRRTAAAGVQAAAELAEQ